MTETSRPTLRQEMPPLTTGSGRSLWARVDRTYLLRTLVVAFCAALTMSGLTSSWVAGLGLGIGCWPILTEAWEDIRNLRMSMELSMLIAIVAAAAIGELVTSLVIMTFVLAAELLEDLSMDRGRDALTDLMSFLPDSVQVRDGDTVTTVPLDQVTPGQLVVVLPGGRIPVDGTVVTGRSTVDQSRITGESLPIEIDAGSEVHSGSINQSGAVEIRAESVGAESSFGRIIEAVRKAQESEPPVQRLADRLAAWLVYLAIGGAALTFLLTHDLTATISVVVVVGACGIAAGTPLAVLAAIARTARSGAFVKDGAHLEMLSSVDTVVFDKTGTITTGTPTVVGVHVEEGRSLPELLGYAASAESWSEHPLGQAILTRARDEGIPMAHPEDFDYAPRARRYRAGRWPQDRRRESTPRSRRPGCPWRAGIGVSGSREHRRRLCRHHSAGRRDPQDQPGGHRRTGAPRAADPHDHGRRRSHGPNGGLRGRDRRFPGRPASR